MLAPEALCGVGAVLLLHNTVKRTLGHRAAMLAALMLALTPIFVAMSRFNNPDALLVLLEVAAAWALVRALQSGRTREVLLCGVFVGLAFNVKMLQAYLIVPGLALTLLIAGAGQRFDGALRSCWRAAAAMFFVSFVWYGTMMLIPAADRPWVGDTTDNSWFSLIFGANGLSRVSGESSGPGRRRQLRWRRRAVAAVQLDRRRSDRLVAAARGGRAGARTLDSSPFLAHRPAPLRLLVVGRLGLRLLGGVQLLQRHLSPLLHDGARARRGRARGRRTGGAVGPLA